MSSTSISSEDVRRALVNWPRCDLCTQWIEAFVSHPNGKLTGVCPELHSWAFDELPKSVADFYEEIGFEVEQLHS